MYAVYQWSPVYNLQLSKCAQGVGAHPSLSGRSGGALLCPDVHDGMQVPAQFSGEGKIVTL